jgi:hypothetical protein
LADELPAWDANPMPMGITCPAKPADLLHQMTLQPLSAMRWQLYFCIFNTGVK